MQLLKLSNILLHISVCGPSNIISITEDLLERLFLSPSPTQPEPGPTAQQSCFSKLSKHSEPTS